jgi:vacuolar-type H+-ATPase subunit E/Vma4
MNEIVGIVRAQLDGLLELLEQSKTRYCETTLEAARSQAADYRKRARRVARERVHRAVSSERERMERELRLAVAGIETEQRRLGRQRDLELIRTGWTALEDALRARWRDDEGRRGWVDAALQAAGSLIPGKDWTIEHPADWPEDERDRALARAREVFGVKARSASADDLEAGLRIVNGGTVLDMSPPGILAQRRTIEAELLAELGDRPHDAGGEEA